MAECTGLWPADAPGLAVAEGGARAPQETGGSGLGKGLAGPLPDYTASRTSLLQLTDSHSFMGFCLKCQPLYMDANLYSDIRIGSVEL